MRAFNTIQLKPHLLQYFINEWWHALLCVTSFAIAGLDMMEGSTIPTLLMWLGILLALYLAYQFVYLLRIRYVVTEEHLVFLHGVFQHSTDYMELYRVVDYQQNRSLLQQLLGLKTVTILSGDRNMGRLDIIGVREDENIVSEIRKRVEYNKRMKSIYEITNRF
jgi:uncharacterized membrane protein YdbT with pleckstrin-like domain